MNDQGLKLLSTLTASERAYASAYADFLSVGDPEPARPADVDPELAADIRAVLGAEWAGRLNASPALSGRLKITRRRLERGSGSG